MHSLTVEGPGFAAYEVRVGRGLLQEAGAAVGPLLAGRRTAVISDETVAALHGPTLIGALGQAGITAELITIPAGEASKSFAELERVLDRLLALGLDRSDTVIALGGGVVGDLAGLAAGLYMRGVACIQIPTTLLAQVDSSVGGKTAIDTPRGKNLVGVFHHPKLVLADIGVLGTLPERQLRAGWAEVIKHGLICDADFFDWVAGDGAAGAHGDEAALEQAVVRSVQIKAAIVGEDARESGRRALLNLGHTFAHALEAETGFGEGLLHGEAVAVGCALAFRFSAAQGLCPRADADRAAAAMGAAGLPAGLAQIAAGPFEADRLIARMRGDKKAEGGRLTLVLARGVGEAFVARDVDAGAVRRFLVAEGASG